MLGCRPAPYFEVPKLWLLLSSPYRSVRGQVMTALLLYGSALWWPMYVYHTRHCDVLVVLVAVFVRKRTQMAKGLPRVLSSSTRDPLRRYGITPSSVFAARSLNEGWSRRRCRSRGSFVERKAFFPTSFVSLMMKTLGISEF